MLKLCRYDVMMFLAMVLMYWGHCWQKPHFFDMDHFLLIGLGNMRANTEHNAKLLQLCCKLMFRWYPCHRKWYRCTFILSYAFSCFYFLHISALDILCQDIANFYRHRDPQVCWHRDPRIQTEVWCSGKRFLWHSFSMFVHLFCPSTSCLTTWAV